MTWIHRPLALAATLLAILAVLDQVRRRPEDRDWHGRVLGVPYDFRAPSLDWLLDRVWNPSDERIIVPQAVGIGWSINLFQLKRRAQLLIA